MSARDQLVLIFFGYLLVITIAEVLTTMIAPQSSALLYSFLLTQYALLLLMLLLHAATSWHRPERNLLLSLAFAPLIRLISLSLPLRAFPLVYWYLITSVPLFITGGLLVKQVGYPWRAIGLNGRKLLWQLPIGLSGVVIGYVEYVILRPEPLVSSFSWAAVLLPGLILLVCTGLLEEFLFRGIMQTAAFESLGKLLGMVYVAAIFAVLHVGYNSWQDVLFVFLVGLFFGWAVDKTGSIVGVTFAHGMANITLFLVMPFTSFGGEIFVIAPAIAQFLRDNGIWLVLAIANFAFMSLLVLRLETAVPAQSNWIDQ